MSDAGEKHFDPVSHIHQTAIVDKRAKLHASVTVGPYTVIDGDVEVGEGTTIGAHNVVTGHTKIGRDNRIFHFCSIGEANQDKIERSLEMVVGMLGILDRKSVV